MTDLLKEFNMKWGGLPRFLFLVLMLTLSPWAKAAFAEAASLRLTGIQTGDILFLDLYFGPIGDAIKEVTKSQFPPHNSPLVANHLGIVSIEEGEVYIYESLPRVGVVRNPLPQVLKRVSRGENEPLGYWWGRFKDEYRALAVDAAAEAKQYLGRPYNESFRLQSDRIYCAQLLYYSYRGANYGRDFFHLSPMVFENGDPRINKIWQDYFGRLGVPVPKGELGISPHGIYVQGRTSFFK